MKDCSTHYHFPTYAPQNTSCLERYTVLLNTCSTARFRFGKCEKLLPSVGDSLGTLIY